MEGGGSEGGVGVTVAMSEMVSFGRREAIKRTSEVSPNQKFWIFCRAFYLLFLN
jgi:hypothetical protein